MDSYNSENKNLTNFEQTPFFQNFARMLISSFSEGMISDTQTIQDVYTAVNSAPLAPQNRHQLSEALRYAFEHFAILSGRVLDTDVSSVDSLTGLLVRDTFQSTFEEFQQKNLYPIAIVTGDVNNLKLTNDVFGHEYGDTLLKTIANIMISEASPDYKLFRIGGDEFYALLPHTTLEEATRYCERISASCKEHKNLMLPLSISLGASVVTDSCGDFKKMLAVAENVMYHEKTIFKDKANLFSDILQVLFDEGFLRPDILDESIRMVTAFAEYLELDPESISKLQLAARIQDIGLIAIPKEIVCKRSMLTEEETEIIRKHVENGYRLAKLYEESFPVAGLILQSHEAWCGLGYPNKRKGKDIALTARILYLVSTFISWLAPKPWGSSQAFDIAFERLDERSGNQFEPELVVKFKVFLQTYDTPTF